MMDKKMKSLTPKGMKLLIDSNLPKDTEVAWGAALTVCSMVTIAKANKVLDKFP